jgi:hypothetical protein
MHKKRPKSSVSGKGSGKKSKNENTIMASVTGEYVSGTVYFSQSGNKYTDGHWTVVLDDVNIEALTDMDCGGGLNWHIHEFTLDESRPECTDLGGHWDPTYGCGGASQHDNTGVCDFLYNGTKTCTPEEDITMCEIGDLSGKMGRIALDTSYEQTYEDVYITNINVFSKLSIVFHCGSPRVACGNLAFV